MEADTYRSAIQRAVTTMADVSFNSQEATRLYETYQESQYAHHMLASIFSNLSHTPINILDVGSGRAMTANIAIANHKNVNIYTAIDRSINASVFICEIQRYIQKFQYIQVDVENADLNITNDVNDLYDVVIIDIEPHGDEVDIYNKISKYMKPTHICILKHVGFIDMHGPFHADRFIANNIERIHDYFAQSSLKQGLRDIFIVMSRTPVTLDAQCQKLAKGRLAGYADKTIRQYVLDSY